MIKRYKSSKAQIKQTSGVCVVIILLVITSLFISKSTLQNFFVVVGTWTAFYMGIIYLAWTSYLEIDEEKGIFIYYYWPIKHKIPINKIKKIGYRILQLKYDQNIRMYLTFDKTQNFKKSKIEIPALSFGSNTLNEVKIQLLNLNPEIQIDKKHHNFVETNYP